MKQSTLYIIIIILLFSACMVQKEFNKVSFVHVASNQKQQKKIKYTIQVPIGYKFERITAGGEVGTEDKYIYPDSSILYLSDFGGTQNNKNIEQQGYSSKKFEFSMKQTNEDTLILEGQNIKGLYWKEITIGKLDVGYLNVPLDRKKIFDEALESLENK